MKRWLVLCLALVFSVTLGGIADVSASTKTEKAPAKTEGKPDTKAPAKADDKKSGKKIDLNSATVDELRTLDGIGEALSKKIVDNRPYKGKNEIVKKASVPQATYDKIKDHIIAKQGTADKKMDDKKMDAKKDDKKK